MKVCERCGREIDTKDGENMCRDCDNSKRQKGLRKKEREEILRSLGLTKVKGSLGGTYWE